MMLAEYFLNNFPFAWRLYTKDRRNNIASGAGTFFQLPKVCESAKCLAHYRSCAIGWSVCPAGYAVFAKEIELRGDYVLVLPGLKVNGLGTARGKSDGVSIRTERQPIEDLVSRSIDAFDALQQEYNKIALTNIHEIRSINSDLYNAAYQLQDALDRNPTLISNSKLSKSITAYSEVIKARIDFYDYLTNSALEKLPRNSVVVFKKFDKIVMSMMPEARDRNVYLALSGQSTGVIHGLPMFDVVPYILVHNAIKYSPNRRELAQGEEVRVEVSLHEDDEFIHAQVDSVGPELKPDELERLCVPGFRGDYAIQTGKSGSGYGLAAAKGIVERFHRGKFEFIQTEFKYVVHGIPYRKTSVRIRVPRSDGHSQV